MPSESKNWRLPEKIALAVVLASSLLLAGCPASTPTTPSSSGSGAPGSSSSGGASGSSSSGGMGMPGSDGGMGMPGSDGGMGMPGSDGGMGMPGSDGGGQPGTSGGSQGDGEDVWQPEGGGGMPGPGGGQSSGREQAGTDSGGGETGGGESGESSASTGMDDLLDMSLEDFDDSMPDLSDDTGAAGEAGGQGDTSTASGEGESPGSSSENTGTANNGAMTTGERVAVLDARLERSTGQFDDLILQEREVIRRTTQSRPAPPGAGHGPGLETGDSAAGREDYGIMPGGSGAGGSGGGSAGGNVARGAGVPDQARVYPVPADVPDGDDDDVVAAQLREAAMREADPQLREKLWDEYRKYKGLD